MNERRNIFLAHRQPSIAHVVDIRERRMPASVDFLYRNGIVAR